MIRTLIGLFCLTLFSAADTTEQEKAALKFLDSIAKDELMVVDETAIIDGTTPEKFKIITRQLKRLSKHLSISELTVINSRVENGLAGVVIAQMSELDPTKTQIHLVALVQRDDTWLPAPVLGSFENTGVRYTPSLGDAARKLENWMVTERSSRLDNIQEELWRKMQAEIAATMSRDQLIKSSAEDVVQDFIEACRTGKACIRPGVSRRNGKGAARGLAGNHRAGITWTEPSQGT